MSARTATTPASQGLKLHGLAGFVILIVAPMLRFMGNEWVGHWFTPILWTGYILFIDAINFRLRGRSLLVSDRRELLIVAVISIANWWLFELYNAPRFWKSNLELWWHYHNLEPNLFLRRIGYDWSFATISPAMFETAELFGVTLFRRQRAAPPIRIGKPAMYAMVAVGLAAATLPLVMISPWLVPLVWLSFIFVFDPINALSGRPSVISDLARGQWRRLLSLLAAGLLCGLLWELWNYWALTKWTYTVPYAGSLKIFEMPVLGYFGFPPFAIECWATYVLVRGWVLGLGGWGSESVCPTLARRSQTAGT